MRPVFSTASRTASSRRSTCASRRCSAIPRTRDIDNPFAITYILDAVGSSARAVYPNPRVWRPFMERVLADLTPEINKLYISLNRFLADRGVLPEIKAALRARSEYRPHDDKDLLPTFTKMLHDALPDVPRDIVVPETLASRARPPRWCSSDKPAFRFGSREANEMSAAKILAGLANLARRAARRGRGRRNRADRTRRSAAGHGLCPACRARWCRARWCRVPSRRHGDLGPGAPPPDAAAGFPSLDPLMALGASTPLFATLGPLAAPRPADRHRAGGAQASARVPSRAPSSR